MPRETLALQAEQRILILRDQKVMLDFHLAELYGVETRALKQAVRRNPERFPADFMFELDPAELAHLRSQTVIPSFHGGSRHGHVAFTEQGVAMLSSVLRGERAVLVNIAIMRAFVRLRQLLATHAELAGKLDEMEKNTTASSAWSSMPSAASWPRPPNPPAKWASTPSRNPPERRKPDQRLVSSSSHGLHPHITLRSKCPPDATMLVSRD